MPIRYSYTDAADRLLTDAFALWEQGTRETAGHLAGLSTECVLKSILVGLKLIVVASDGQMEDPKKEKGNKPWRIHLDRLWSEFHLQLSGRSGMMYVSLLPMSAPAPFDGWSVDHRYVASGQLGGADLERWMWAAIAMREVLRQAVTNGEAQ